MPFSIKLCLISVLIQVYESGIEKDVAKLKLQASKAIEREDYLTAIELYTKVF